MKHVIAFKRETKFCPIQVGGKFQRSDSVPVPNQQGSENLSNQMESQAVRNEPVLPMNDQGASNEPNWAMNAFPDRLQMTNISQQPTVSQPAESQG